MTLPSPRLLIVDQSLRDMAGHHYEYDLALFRAATAASVPTVIGAHASVRPLDLLGASVRPWFQRAWYEARSTPAAPSRFRWLPGRIRWALGRLRRALSSSNKTSTRIKSGSKLGDEVFELIFTEQLGPTDHVLVHTFSIPELDSLIELARNEHALPLMHVVFRRDAEEPSVAIGPNGGIRGSLTRLASSPAPMRTMRLYADTEDLARQHGELAPGLTVGTLPIPHCLPSDRTSGLPRKAGPLRIVYLGDARGEKGFHLLPDLVDALADKLFPDARARFVFQANVSVGGDSPVLSEARRRLAAYPSAQVELMLEQLEISAFHGLLRSADIVVLPYDRHAYARRSSGILIQALAAGRVVVVPSQTWMARQVDSGASLLFEDPGSLSEAVMTAVGQWPSLWKRADARAPFWQAQHDAALFIRQLLRASR